MPVKVKGYIEEKGIMIMTNINIHFGQCVLQEGGSTLLASREKLHKAQG